jgi:hypothetical protein
MPAKTTTRKAHTRTIKTGPHNCTKVIHVKKTTVKKPTKKK